MYWACSKGTGVNVDGISILHAIYTKKNGKMEKMKKNSYNVFKNKLSGRSYYCDMDSVMASINNNAIR